MINKYVKSLLLVSLTVGLVFIVACSMEKNVRTEAFDLFKEEISSNEIIDEMEIKFLRPSLYISFITTKEFKDEDVQKIIDKLRPVINTNHMQEIANRYWEKDTKIASVHIYFYDGNIDKNDTQKNLKYNIFTSYYKTKFVEEDPSNIDAYSTWFVELDGKEYQIEDYLDQSY